MTPRRKISVLVIDDSASNRRALSQLLESAADVEVLDRAADGEEGLRKAAELKPDVITLDLEMPRMDGFSFLRLLMATVPTPVIVISSYAHKSDVFKALELGAFDFIAKPRRSGKEELDAVRDELLEKIRAVRHARPQETPARVLAPKSGPSTDTPLQIVCVGASTGGPPAVQKLVESAAAEPSACLLVVQHMPAKFTTAFAERLDRLDCGFEVVEGEEGLVLGPGKVVIAAGGKQMKLASRGKSLVIRTQAVREEDKHAPSVDRLFASAAETLGGRAFGIILTGMGSDGAQGAKAIARAGGEVWAESEETAVIFGMPREAIETGAVKRVLPLPDLSRALVERLKREKSR